LQAQNFRAIVARAMTSFSWLQTVSASTAVQQAKALQAPVEGVNKGKVWLLLCGGAAGLFATTLLVENNEAWFPAIARANKQMSSTASEGDDGKVADSTPEGEEETIDVDSRAEAAVLEGLKAARDRVQERPRQQQP
jgi:hypothetical protein